MLPSATERKGVKSVPAALHSTLRGTASSCTNGSRADPGPVKARRRTNVGSMYDGSGWPLAVMGCERSVQRRVMRMRLRLAQGGLSKDCLHTRRHSRVRRFVYEEGEGTLEGEFQGYGARRVWSRLV
jgi:hypothetical protein